ncbi:F-box/LRR-repeat protein 17-like isoform X2 [Branchiostoma lanceolatum]|uniref:F-box/LRR-repeat protein 17-like isoform X2 n=1 Tax=Branchiostoma lanceolatum TaxID=7740 RepID=UPI003455FC27
MEDVSRRTERDLCAITGDVESLSIENNNLPRELPPLESVGNNNDVEEDTCLTSVHGRDKHHQEHKSKRTAWMQPTEADGNCNVISQDVPESLQNDSNIPVLCCDDQQQTISQPSYRYSVQIKQRGDDTELVEPPDTCMHACMDAGADDDIPEYPEGVDRQDTDNYTGTGAVDFTEQSLQTDLRNSEPWQHKSDGSQEGQVSPEDGSQGQVSPEDGSEGQDDDVISEESLLESAAMLQSHVVMLDGAASPGGTMSVEGGDGRQSAEMFRKVMLSQVQQQLEDLDRELKMHLVKSEQCLLLNRSKLSSYMAQAEAVFSDDAADMEGAACGQQEDELLLPLDEGNFSLKDLQDSDSDSSQQGEGEGEREASPAAGGYWREVEIEASCAANGYLREGEREVSPAGGGYWREELVFANKIQELERAVEERITAIRPPEDADEEGAEDVTRFQHLPTELVVRILSHLTPQELCERVAPVCRAWYRHAHDPLLWRELDLDFTHDVQAVDLCAVIRRAPLLKVLVMRGRNELTITEVSVFVQHCGMLQQLDMGFCKVLDLTMLHIIVDNCPQLEEVNVEGCVSIRDSCLMVLSRLSRLKVLNLSHCTSVTDDGVCHLVRNCPGLVSLNIDGIAWITDSAVQDLAACCPSMRQLYLDGDELTDASISAVTDSCAQLELLDISFCEGVTDLSVHNIPRLQYLEHLRLKRGMQLSTAVMLHLFTSSTLTGLTYLNLTECTAVNNGAVERITKCCPHLKELYLCWCWDITEEGLEHIINNLSKLHHLDVTGLDKITGACLTSLPSALPLLTFLNLQQCNRVQDEVLSTLVATVTDLTIVDYYGNHVPPLLAPFH